MQMTVGGFPAVIRQMPYQDIRSLPIHRLAALFPVIEGDDRERLSQSLQRGYDDVHPLIVWDRTGEIVDGRNRSALAVELRIAAPVAFVQFENEQQVAAYIVSANLARRHLKKPARDVLARKLAEEGMKPKEIAVIVGTTPRRVRQLTTNERAQAKTAQADKITTELAAGKSQREIARETGVAEGTVRKVRKKGKNFPNYASGNGAAVPEAATAPLSAVSINSAPEDNDDDLSPVASGTAKEHARHLRELIPDIELRRRLLTVLAEIRQLRCDEETAAPIIAAFNLLDQLGDFSIPVNTLMRRASAHL